MADLLTKREGCICTGKRPVTFLIFHSICLFSFPVNPFNSYQEKTHARIVCRPSRQVAESVIRSIISCSLQLRLESNESKKNSDKTLKWTFGYCNLFLTQVSVIFIQENAAFIQVLNYQDWHNQLITINK